MGKGGRPPKFKKVKDLEESIETYFTGLLETDYNRPTISGLAHHLGFESRQSIYDYINRGDQFSYTIKRALLKIEEIHEQNLFGTGATGSIFWLKNRGWQDKQHHDHTTDGDKITNVTVEVVNEPPNKG
nr:hypothetical protein 34 [bacterium]